MQVALKRFIDDIAVQIIEGQLVSPLGDIFSPVAISIMPIDLVTCIAGETKEDRALREQLAKQLKVLTKGSDTCKRFIGVRLPGKADVWLLTVVIAYLQRQMQMTTRLDLAPIKTQIHLALTYPSGVSSHLRES